MTNKLQPVSMLALLLAAGEQFRQNIQTADTDLSTLSEMFQVAVITIITSIAYCFQNYTVNKRIN